MAETEPLDILPNNNEIPPEKADEDDLEEGELRDDDDDDDEEKEKQDDDQVSPKAKSSTSGDETPARPPSPASSSSSSSSSPSSSTSSSSSSSSSLSSSKSKALSSHRSSSSKNNNSITNTNNNTNHSTTSSNYDRNSRSRFSGNRRVSEDRYRTGWSLEKEDPSEKAAKLISMRTKLLEARSREIELKFAKNKGKLPSPPPPTLISSGPQKVVKMTIAKPIISYSENPNPPAIWLTPSLSTPIETPKKKSSKSKSRHSEKERKSKKKSKKHKKRKSSTSSSSTKKSSSESKTTAPLAAPVTPPAAAVASSSSEPEAPVEIKESKELVELPYDNQDHVGPRTPPDNHVLTLDDEQIEWPSHLIRMTTTQPSISYSVNPDWYHRTRIRERREAASEERANKKRKHDEIQSSIPLSPSLEATSEFTWYYNYFVNSFEMDHNQAQHQAYSAIISASCEDEHRGEDVVSIGPVRPKYTEVKTEKELVLPNGQVLPAGTVQKIVHPYPRIDSEVLGPLFDLY